MLYLIPLVFLCMLFFMAIKLARSYERFGVNRMGRFVGVRGPGFVFIIPFLEQWYKFDTRIKVRETGAQEVITKDNIPAKVIVVYSYEILNPTKVGGDPWSWLSDKMTGAVNRVVGESTLDQIIGDRELINERLRHYVGGNNPENGWVVHSAEFKSIDLPPEMDALIQKESLAERERRALVVAAEGEADAAEKLSAAAALMGAYPEALQLRALQSAETAGKEQSGSMIMPVGYQLFDGVFFEKKPDEETESK